MTIAELYGMFGSVNSSTLILVYDDMKKFYEYGTPFNSNTYNLLHNDVKYDYRIILFEYDSSNRLRVLIKR